MIRFDRCPERAGADQGWAGGKYAELGTRQLRLLANELEVAWSGLTQLEASGRLGTTLDEGTLRALREVTETYYRARRHHGTWGAFQHFLANPDSVHPGVEARRLERALPSV